VMSLTSGVPKGRFRDEFLGEHRPVGPGGGRGGHRGAGGL
jgi:hypothetical protein